MSDQTVTVRMFGLLRPMCEDQGLPSTRTVAVPGSGITARELVTQMGFDPEQIEGVFVNHTMFGLSKTVAPGDRVAFVPYGTPGPHRVYLGIYQAGRSEHEG
jgi:molybdopterin converting factor small subunit